MQKGLCIHLVQVVHTNQHLLSVTLFVLMQKKQRRGRTSKTLISKGYLKTEATGYFGKLTFAAVKAFQKDNKLKDDGIVGKVTKTF